MTYEEIKEKLQEKFGDDIYNCVDALECGGDEMEEIFGEYKEVDNYGGEGKGNTYYSIFYFPQHDVYLRIDGFYSSYEGVTYEDGWDSIRQVKPVQKTVTDYE